MSLDALLTSLDCDIVCLQETKLGASSSSLPADLVDLPSFVPHYALVRPPTPLGYSGVATFCRRGVWEPIAVEDGFSGLTVQAPIGPPSEGGLQSPLCQQAFSELPRADVEALLAVAARSVLPGGAEERRVTLAALESEGRCLITDHGPFILLNVYFPNDANAARASFRCAFYAAILLKCQLLAASGKHVILLGDVNACYDMRDHCEFAPKYSAVQRLFAKEGCKANNSTPDAASSHELFDGLVAALTSRLLRASRSPRGPAEEAPPSWHRYCSGSMIGRIEELISLFYQEPGKEMRSILFQNIIRPSLHPPDAPLLCMQPPQQYGPSVALIDTFRLHHPMAMQAYTCWNTKYGARKTNYGTRLDAIFLCYHRTPRKVCDPNACSEESVSMPGDASAVKDVVTDSGILPLVGGSDHCPAWAQFDFAPPPLSTRRVQPRHLTGGKGVPVQRKISDFVKRAPPACGSTAAQEAAQSMQAQAGSDQNRDAKRPAVRITDYFGSSSSAQKSDEGTPLWPPPVMESHANSTTLGREMKPSKAIQREEYEIDVDALDAASSFHSIFNRPAARPRCKGHEEECTLRKVTKRGANFGRSFYSCARGVSESAMEGPCDHFQWLYRPPSAGGALGRERKRPAASSPPRQE